MKSYGGFDEEQETRKEREDFYKQNKELEKYKIYYENMKEVNKKFISADKIKAKIEEYKEILKSSIINDRYKVEVNNIIRVLQELLEEDETNE